jgi:hypothetical protein
VDATLSALRTSPKTASQKAKFILATDGIEFQAEDMSGGGSEACAYAQSTSTTAPHPRLPFPFWIGPVGKKYRAVPPDHLFS